MKILVLQNLFPQVFVPQNLSPETSKKTHRKSCDLPPINVHLLIKYLSDKEGAERKQFDEKMSKKDEKSHFQR